jgi:hypothetical protein
MDKIRKEEIITSAIEFFETVITKNHISNLKKLNKLSAFTYNPFLLKYLANFLTGNNDSLSIAKILLYPRALGTSINTSFGNNLQRFISEVLEGFGSVIPGIDIEFIDQVDKRKKYCQIKAGPQTINKDDIETIKGHFSKVKNLARTNHLDISLNDLTIGVLYGSVDELSPFYKTLNQDYTVLCGAEFWERLTGDKLFYIELIEAFGVAAKKVDVKELFDSILNELAIDIENNFIKEQIGEPLQE